MIYLILIVFVAFCAQKSETSPVSLYKMFVNDDQVGFNSILWIDRNLPVIIACRMTTANTTLVMKKIADSRIYKLASARTIPYNHYIFLNYTLTRYDKWSLVSTYRCVDERRPYAPNYSQVTISFTLDLPSTPADTLPPPHAITHPPTHWHSGHRGTIPPTDVHTTKETHTLSPGIHGLNPLIYAISVLILLGSLAIVILITCWIRVRRSYNRRHYQLSNNPQEYLDYISDNDLTPLASSELAASFEERPPSYGESEEMNSEIKSSGSARERQNGGGRRIVESVLRRSRNLSSSVLGQNSSRNVNLDRESSESANDGPLDDPNIGISGSLSARPTLTSPITSRVAAVSRPLPRPSVVAAQLTIRSTSLNTTIEQDSELSCSAITKGNVDGPGIMIARRRPPQILQATSIAEDSSGAIHDHNAPGCTSNELMPNRMDLNAQNGNGTRGPSSEPTLQSESDHEIPVGILIDLT